MSEEGFIAFNMAFAAVVELLYALCFSLFLRPFLAKKRRWVLLFGTYLLLCLLCDSAAIPKGTFGVLLIVLPTAAAAALGIERAKAFLLALLYWNARTASALMIESLYYFLERWTPAAEIPEAIFRRSAMLLTVFLASNAALFAAMPVSYTHLTLPTIGG